MLRISCEPLDWQISSLAQGCSTSFPSFLTLEGLDIDIEMDRESPLDGKAGIRNYLEALKDR
jgi:hypothetical protein